MLVEHEGITYEVPLEEIGTIEPRVDDMTAMVLMKKARIMAGETVNPKRHVVTREPSRSRIVHAEFV